MFFTQPGFMPTQVIVPAGHHLENGVTVPNGHHLENGVSVRDGHHLENGQAVQDGHHLQNGQAVPNVQLVPIIIGQVQVTNQFGQMVLQDFKIGIPAGKSLNWPMVQAGFFKLMSDNSNAPSNYEKTLFGNWVRSECLN